MFASTKVEIHTGDVFALKVSPHSLFLDRFDFLRGDVGLKAFRGFVLLFVLLLTAAVTYRLEVVQLLLDTGQLFRVGLVFVGISLDHPRCRYALR